MDHGEGHAIEHAHLECDRTVKEAVRRQIARLDEAMARLAGDLPVAEVAPAIAGAGELISSLYEQSKGSWCPCRVEGWCSNTWVQLQRHAVRHLGEKAGVERVRLSWEFHRPPDRDEFWARFRGRVKGVGHRSREASAGSVSAKAARAR